MSAVRVALLGDSIFDNEPYTAPGDAVLPTLHRILPSGWRADLGAVDGAYTSDVRSQVEGIDPAVTHLVVSVGGNDALSCVGLIDDQSPVAHPVLDRLTLIRATFRKSYRAMLQAVTSRGLPVVVCTIYDQVPDLAENLRTALAVFNEVILFEAVSAGVPVMDLRSLCDEPEDYSRCFVHRAVGPGLVQDGPSLDRDLVEARLLGQTVFHLWKAGVEMTFSCTLKKSDKKAIWQFKKNSHVLVGAFGMQNHLDEAVQALGCDPQQTSTIFEFVYTDREPAEWTFHLSYLDTNVDRTRFRVVASRAGALTGVIWLPTELFRPFGPLSAVWVNVTVSDQVRKNFMATMTGE